MFGVQECGRKKIGPIFEVAAPKRIFYLISGFERLYLLDQTDRFASREPGNEMTYLLNRICVHAEFAGTESDQKGHIKGRTRHFTANGKGNACIFGGGQNVP